MYWNILYDTVSLYTWWYIRTINFYADLYTVDIFAEIPRNYFQDWDNLPIGSGTGTGLGPV